MNGCSNSAGSTGGGGRGSGGGQSSINEDDATAAAAAAAADRPLLAEKDRLIRTQARRIELLEAEAERARRQRDQLATKVVLLSKKLQMYSRDALHQGRHLQPEHQQQPQHDSKCRHHHHHQQQQQQQHQQVNVLVERGVNRCDRWASIYRLTV